MNSLNTNEGGYGKSYMAYWLCDVLLPAFPAKLRGKVTCITLPTYGEIFGHDDFYENLEADEDEQLPLMQERRNRVCDLNGDWCSWWLCNAMKADKSSNSFLAVNISGLSSYDGATHLNGVRYKFWMVR